MYLIVKAKYYNKFFISAAHKFCDNITIFNVKPVITIKHRKSKGSP